MWRARCLGQSQPKVLSAERRLKIKVYWGITASRSYRKSIPHDEPVMLSAGGLWNGQRFRGYTVHWNDWFLDSGGFVAMNKWGDYPFAPDQYLALVAERRPSVAASMDYPCEPEISRESKATNEERIRATVELAEYLCPKDSRIIPVLQGYTLDEFHHCWELLNRRLSIKRLAIGSLCKRQSSKQIADLAWGFRQFIPRGIPVHGFGLKLKALDHPEVWAVFGSIDTDAWESYTRWLEAKTGNHVGDWPGWLTYSRMVAQRCRAPRQLMLEA